MGPKKKNARAAKKPPKKADPPPLPTAPILAFFATDNPAADTSGRTLSHILTWNDRSLADNDDYIHLLFPTYDPRSRPSLPLVDGEIVAAFRADPALRARLRRAFALMLRFYGFVTAPDGQEIFRDPEYPQEWNAGAGWEQGGKHHPYISRMIVSLRLLGLEGEARAFWDALSDRRFLRGFRVPKAGLEAWRACVRIDLAEQLDLPGGLPEVQGEEVSELEELAREEDPPQPKSFPAGFSVPSPTPSPIGDQDAYAAALPSWTTDNIRPGLTIRPVFGPALLPSPLTTPETRFTHWKTTLKTRHPDLVAAFYDMVLQHFSATRKRRKITDHLKDDFDVGGRSGYVCYLVPRATAERTTSHYECASPHFQNFKVPCTIYPPPIELAQGVVTFPTVSQVGESDQENGPSIEIMPLMSPLRTNQRRDAQVPFIINRRDRRLSQPTNHLDHFIINRRHQLFRVNGVDVDISMLAGPLPDFCVIEVDDTVALWWQTNEAFTYHPPVPEYKRKKRNIIDVNNDPNEEPERGTASQGKRRKKNGSAKKDAPSKVAKPHETKSISEKSTSDTSTQDKSKRVKSSKEKWCRKFNQGLERHQNARGNRRNEISLSRSRSLTDEDVVNGIAPFWISLVQHDVVFGFGTVDVFTSCRTAEDQEVLKMVACGINGPFVMPLLFSPDQAEAYETIQRHEHNLRTRSSKTSSNQSSQSSRGSKTSQEKQGVEIGHLLLVVAEKDPQSTNKITTTIYDSYPGCLPRQRIRRVYRGLITHSGWLGISGEGVPLQVQPSFTEQFAAVPHQDPEEGNTCGIYTILNAWAYMLNIPLEVSRDRNRPTRHVRREDFHTNAVEIIELALGGNMDAETVQAFMNCYEYCESQDFENPTPDLRIVDAVRLSSNTLQAEVEDLRELDLVTAMSEH